MCNSLCIKSKHFSMHLQTATVSPRITFVFWRMVGRSATTRTSLVSLATMMSLLDDGLAEHYIHPWSLLGLWLLLPGEEGMMCDS